MCSHCDQIIESTDPSVAVCCGCCGGTIVFGGHDNPDFYGDGRQMLEHMDMRASTVCGGKCLLCNSVIHVSKPGMQMVCPCTTWKVVMGESRPYIICSSPMIESDTFVLYYPTPSTDTPEVCTSQTVPVSLDSV